MRVITEAELREEYKIRRFDSYQLPAGAKLTPAAAQFLSERRIKLAEVCTVVHAASGRAYSVPAEPKEGYVIQATGEVISTKPESLTHLRGKRLVPKNNPRIKFRGKLDSLQAYLILVILDAEQGGQLQLAGDLTQLLGYCRKIMSAEVREVPLEPLKFHGLNLEEIREYSHHPEKFYGIGHLLPQPTHGKLVGQLNFLRTQCRELEISAVEAFYEVGGERADILQALNRLSSLVYLMMLQLASGRYKIGPTEAGQQHNYLLQR